MEPHPQFQGLLDLQADEVMQRDNVITQEELEWMRTIRFMPDDKPTSQTYVDILLKARDLPE